LLFGGDVTWTKYGFRNINKMKEKTEKHEKSKKHVDNVISLSLLGSVSIKEKLSSLHGEVNGRVAGLEIPYLYATVTIPSQASRLKQ
jgi:hypothetical protein